MQMLMDPVVAADARLVRFTAKHHSCLLGEASALPVVARLAGTDEIFPTVRTAAMPRDDMVNRQLLRLLATVLAGEVVAQKQLSACELGNGLDAAYEVEKPDYGGACVRARGRTQGHIAEFDHFGPT